MDCLLYLRHKVFLQCNISLCGTALLANQSFYGGTEAGARIVSIGRALDVDRQCASGLFSDSNNADSRHHAGPTFAR